MSIRLVRSVRLSSVLRTTFAVTPKPTLFATGADLASDCRRAFARLREVLVLLIACGAPCSMAVTQIAHFSGARCAAADGSVQDDALRDSPSAVHFGAVGVGGTSAPISLTFTFDETTELGKISVLTQGVQGLDFADTGKGSCKAGTRYSRGETCTLDATFTPKFAGTRYGAAVLNDDSGNVIATGYLQGRGAGPQVNFLPGSESTVASHYPPYLIAADGDGNLYVPDNPGRRVLKYMPSAGGYVQTIPFGDLFYPFGIAVDGAGNLYITDGANNGSLLKETLTSGKFERSTIASGFVTPMGVAVDGSGNVYVADYQPSVVYKETLSADGYSQSKVTSDVLQPYEIAVDGSGNIYIADSNHSRVLKETPSAAGYIQSLIGSGLNTPTGVTVDGTGNVFIADYNNNRLLKETPIGAGYIQSTVSTGSLYLPFSLGVDSRGNVYIAEPLGSHLLKEDFRDPPVLTYTAASNGPQTVTVENIGNAELRLPIPEHGDNPSLSEELTRDDSGESECPLVNADSLKAETLAVGSSCSIKIGVAPTETSTFSGTLALTDNDLNAAGPDYSTQDLLLNANAVKGSTQVTLIASAVYSVRTGQPLTLTAKVTGAPGRAVPTGHITFEGVPASTVAVNGRGVAVWTSSKLKGGPHTVSASYPGDEIYGVSESYSVSFDVVSGPPAKVVPVGEQSWSTQYPQTLTEQLCAEVQDSIGDPYPEVTVKFRGAGVSFEPASAVSNLSGQVCATASTRPGAGNFVATASVGAGASPAMFDLTVNPAPLIVKLNQDSRPYGAPNPVFTVERIHGLLNGDTVTVKATSTATLTSPVGYYPITMTLGGPAGANYAVQNQPTLHVRQAMLTVAANNLTMTEGSAVPTLTYTLTGFVNGDTASVVSGAPVLSTMATSSSPPGQYPITVSIGNLSAANYSFGLTTNGVLTVNP
ncbi:MAG: MBG domain-containing protein [Terracidiphilus sp.]